MADGFTATFRDAGHILGSAIIELTVTDGVGDHHDRLLGRSGRCDTPILRDPTPVSHADFVLVESTYGNREHAPHDAGDRGAGGGDQRGGHRSWRAAGAQLRDRAHAGAGLGSRRAVPRQAIPRLPLYLDSPMASRASDVYLRHPEDYDEETSRAAAFGRLAPRLPRRDLHQRGRPVEGHPHPASPADAGGQLGDAHRRAGSCTT